MSRRLITSALLLLLSALMAGLSPADTRGQASLWAAYDGDTFRIHVEANCSEMPGDWIGLIIKRSALGQCNSETVITPEPLPIARSEPPYELTPYDVTDPVPAPHICYCYQVMALDAAGQPVGVCAPGYPCYDYVAKENAIVTRGTLSLNLHDFARPLFTVCPDACWHPGFLIDYSQVAPASYQPYVETGIALDIYGEIYTDEMPSDHDVTATLIVPTASGQCGPLPIQTESWGRLKAIYR